MYLDSIKTAMLVFPLVAFVFTVPFILTQYHKYGSINALRVLIVYSFILYLLVIYSLVILPLPDVDKVAAMTSPYTNFNPLAFIDDFGKGNPIIWNQPVSWLNAIKNPGFYTFAFNILMTVPFGVYCRYYFRCSLKKTICLSFLLSLFFELTQLSGLYFIYPRPYRVFDVDDLLTNTLGGYLGFLLAGLFMRFLPSREAIDQSSYEMGKSVSGLRRLVYFFLDLGLFFIIYFLISLLTRHYRIWWICVIIYYILLPHLSKGYTLAGYFLHVKAQYYARPLISRCLHILFYFVYYFAFNIFLVWLLFYMYRILHIEGRLALIAGLCLCAYFFLFYIIQFVLVWKNKTIFYDRLFGYRLESTVPHQTSSKNEAQ